MNRKLPWLLGLAALFFGLLVGLFQIHNSDIWWHIAWGKKMLLHLQTLPEATTFYFTPTSSAYLRELPNTFLGDMGLALLYHAGGTIALQLLVLTSLFIGATCVILVPLCLSPRVERTQGHTLYVAALLLFFGFCLGTCQLQVVRNSLSSLALFPAAFAIYSWHCRYGGWKPLLLYPGLFLTWSVIHPSYILGIIALLLLYSGIFLDQLLRRPHALPISRVGVTLALLLLIFAASLTYSWQVRQLLTTTASHGLASISKILTAANAHQHSPSLKSDQNFFSTITKPVWGNNSLPLSGDFIPTWQVLRHPAAWSSLLLSLVAFLLLLCYQGPNKFGALALLGLTSYFGFCYLRGTGYATITATFIIASLLPGILRMPPAGTWNKNRLMMQSILTWIIAILCLCCLLGALKLVLSERGEFFFMEKGRVFGFGKVAAFEESPYAFVKTHFPEAPCFTTMATGSYAALAWQGEKKVFIDSFFAPHPNTLWHDYNTVLSTQDCSIFDQYGIQTALLENSRSDWQNIFFNDEGWRPVAIGLGATVYAKQNMLPANTPVKILFTQTQVDHSPSPTTRRAVAAAYYNCILTLQLHGMGQAAENLMTEHADLFKNLVHHLDVSQRGNIRQEPPGIKPVLLEP